jgi:hypothetical protein
VFVRTEAAIIATTALAFLAAACGGSKATHVAQLGTTATQRVSSGCPSSSSGSSAGSGSSLALEFSRCMRSHGVPKFPDLTSVNLVRSGLPKISLSLQQLGVSSSQFQAAQSACRHLLPNGGETTPSESQQDLNAMRRFARCMRSHGVPSWPDPTNGPAGWGFNLVNVQGFDPNSPQIENKMNECQRQLPSGIGIPLSRPGRPG